MIYVMARKACGESSTLVELASGPAIKLIQKYTNKVESCCQELMVGGHEIERDDQEYPSGITCHTKSCEFTVIDKTD